MLSSGIDCKPITLSGSNQYNMARTVIVVAFVLFCIHSSSGKSINDGVFNAKANPFDESRMHPDVQFVKNDKKSSEELNFGTRANLELNNEFWINNGRKFVDHQLHKQRKETKAKNIILFLGDGMSIPTLTALRAYQGGEETEFSFEKYPDVGMSKTYSVNYQVADSACTATGTRTIYCVVFFLVELMHFLSPLHAAYLTGVKGNYGTIGVNAKVPFKDCKAGQDNSTHTTSIAQWAIDAGKWAGLVTTSRVTDASPAGEFAQQ